MTVLGRNTVKAMAERVILSIVAKYLGRDTALAIAGGLLKGASKKAIPRLLGWVGWALLAWDVVKLADPASRITIPCVSLIAVVRTMKP